MALPLGSWFFQSQEILNANSAKKAKTAKFLFFRANSLHLRLSR